MVIANRGFSAIIFLDGEFVFLLVYFKKIDDLNICQFCRYLTNIFFFDLFISILPA